MTMPTLIRRDNRDFSRRAGNEPGFDPFPQRDLGFDTFCLSRPLLEHVCRRRLGQEPNVELRHRSRVTDVAPSADRRDAVARRQLGQPATPRLVPTDMAGDGNADAVDGD